MCAWECKIKVWKQACLILNLKLKEYEFPLVLGNSLRTDTLLQILLSVPLPREIASYLAKLDLYNLYLEL